MPRTVCDLGDHHVRLQAPDGWMQIEQRGARVVLRDPSCAAPIFLEPLPATIDVDSWIAALVTRKATVDRHQVAANGTARRFVLTMRTSGGVIERAYQLQRVASSRSARAWVAASIDLDGDAARRQLLAQLFPGSSGTPNVSDGSGLRQFIEDAPRAVAGWPGSPGFTLKLPRAHTIADASSLRVLLREGDAPFGWLTCGRTGVNAATVTATLAALQQQRGAFVERVSDMARLAMVPGAAGVVIESTLWVTADATGHLVFSLEKSGGRDQIVDFFRRLVRGLRLWTGGFVGYWTPPAPISWKTFVPAPPPVAPPSDLKAEWESRLCDSMLHHTSVPVSSGYDRRFDFFGNKKVSIYLHAGGRAGWDEEGFLSASVPGLPSFGPGEYQTNKRGTWQVQVKAASAYLVLDFGRDGYHRLELGQTGDTITLDGRRYRYVKI
jgi:hypothetical protein